MRRIRSLACGVLLGSLLATRTVSAVDVFGQPIPPGPPTDVNHEQSARGDTANASFADGSAGMMLIDERWESAFAVALRVGFHAERFSLAAKLGAGIRPSYATEVPDGYDVDSNYVADPNMFVQLSAGYALWASRGFVWTPAVAVMRTDNPAYGTAVGIEMPFVWVSRGRMRIGFETGIWSAFGGYNRAYCNQPELGCQSGERIEFSRSSGFGFASAFVIGLELGGPS